jgi:hypothetical protein
MSSLFFQCKSKKVTERDMGVNDYSDHIFSPEYSRFEVANRGKEGNND